MFCPPPGCLCVSLSSIELNNWVYAPGCLACPERLGMLAISGFICEGSFAGVRDRLPAAHTDCLDQLRLGCPGGGSM